jgi:hypothetical protein
MLTAIAVLLVSAIGGGVVGAYLTTTYPSENICNSCEEKALYQQDLVYESLQREEKQSREEEYMYQEEEDRDEAY